MTGRTPAVRREPPAPTHAMLATLAALEGMAAEYADEIADGIADEIHADAVDEVYGRVAGAAEEVAARLLRARPGDVDMQRARRQVREVLDALLALMEDW